MEASRHFGQMILVNLASLPLCTYIHTLSYQEGSDGSFVDRSFGRVSLMLKSCLGDWDGPFFLIKVS